MGAIPSWVLVAILLFLLLMSAYFSGSETGMMSLNKYRLHSLVRKGDKRAMRVQKLLARPDRLLGVLLTGNTLGNIVASAVMTLLAVRWFGESSVMFASLVLTLIVLMVAEVMPKTVAALYPQAFALRVSGLLSVLLTLFYPVIWIINGAVNGFLRLFGVVVKRNHVEPLSGEDLRGLLRVSQHALTAGRHNMLLGVLDLDHICVDDIMVPRKEIVMVDLRAKWETIAQVLRDCERLRVLVCMGTVEESVGLLHLGRVIGLLQRNCLNKNTILQNLEPIRYIPQKTSLATQLKQFQALQYQVGLVVDEYGDILGLVSVEDIVEEIVGVYGQQSGGVHTGMTPQPDGSHLLAGNLTIRDVNRVMGWNLSVDGPITLNGLIIEHLELIPKRNVGMRIEGYPFEVVSVEGNQVVMVKVYPHLYRLPTVEDSADDETIEE